MALQGQATLPVLPVAWIPSGMIAIIILNNVLGSLGTHYWIVLAEVLRVTL